MVGWSGGGNGYHVGEWRYRSFLGNNGRDRHAELGGIGGVSCFDIRFYLRQSLLRFADGIDTAKSEAPAILCVICMSGYGYVREDSVAVVPIRSLAL